MQQPENSLFGGEVEPVDAIPHDQDGPDEAEIKAVEAHPHDHGQKEQVHPLTGLEVHLNMVDKGGREPSSVMTFSGDQEVKEQEVGMDDNG